MTSPSQRTVLELILGAGTRRLPAGQDRPFLLLEDLVDDPIEWTLCECSAQSTQQRSGSNKVFSLH